MAIGPEAQSDNKKCSYMLQATRNTCSIIKPYSLEQKQNYCVSDHFLWLDSLHICLVDLKSRKFNAVWRHGRGIVL